MSLLSTRNSKDTCPYPQLLNILNDIQCVCLKGSLLNTKALLFNLIECFTFFDAEVTPGCKLLNNFSNYILLLAL